MEAIKDFFGSVGWLIVAFAAGTVLGGPLWTWLKSKLPWNK
jgi:predicted MFS family arabinose efflux permease